MRIVSGTRRLRSFRSRLLFGLALWFAATLAFSAPHVPLGDAEVVAELPAGARFQGEPIQKLTAGRLDVALSVAQFDVARARATGDLRFLGYAEAALQPWNRQIVIAPQVLVLNATILQSRHAFDASLRELDRALAQKPDDVQAWLTRAIVLRVLGRYDEAAASCQHLAATADAGVTMLCTESLRGLTGNLEPAYLRLASMPLQSLAPEALAWRDSELGEMAERRGDDIAAEHWFRDGLKRAPDDLYMRGAYADLLLRHRRAAETLQLLSDYESMETMLLRITVAHEQLQDGNSASAARLLSSAFTLEAQRGDPVHRREQARFLLDVEHRPDAALQAAQDNWRVQREPEDVLILLRAAYAAHAPQAAQAALAFLAETRLQDVRLEPYRSPT